MENDIKKSILIIEDEGAYQKIISEKLRAENFNVILAKNGIEGFDLAIKNHPDFIIADIQMPVMNGLEMLKKLRTDIWGKDAKIIIVSAFDDPEKISTAISLGISEYFLKTDINISKLVERIKEQVSY